MKKAICILASAFLLSGGAVFAQGEMDAYKFSQYDLSGTARYLGMGGAFGALGGDISVIVEAVVRAVDVQAVVVRDNTSMNNLY